ncbi:MAG: hypothetical protein LBP33_11640 [Candidatus Adiutrix sp.]|jgi:hypothetical protein|nr:hypothetical protein [Candidatus Adiutrix sp.]
MKAWLPILIDNLDESPVLALSTTRNLARAAVYDRRGEILAGALGSPGLASQAAEEARLMKPGECRLLTPAGLLTLECLAPEPDVISFWNTASQNQAGAWASWLLTMPRIENGALQLARHLLSAFGLWTTPRLPEEYRDQWSLLPLKAGLGRLFIFGDDLLALETAALAARTGLTVTWLSAVAQDSPELDEARLLGDFELRSLKDWASSLSPGRLADLGVKEGVRILVTTAEHRSFLDSLRESRPAYLALSGEAEGDQPTGLFPKALTTSQKALGLVAEMLRQ